MYIRNLMICNYVTTIVTEASTVMVTTTVNEPRITTTANGARVTTTVGSSTMIMILETNNPNDTDIFNNEGEAFKYLQDLCMHNINLIIGPYVPYT